MVIRGPHGQLSHCAQLVLRAAVGDFHALSVVELFQQVRVLAASEITMTFSRHWTEQSEFLGIGIRFFQPWKLLDVIGVEQRRLSLCSLQSQEAE